MATKAGKTLEYSIHLRQGQRGKQHVATGEAPAQPEPHQVRIPRITRLLALAIKMDGMLQRGEVKNYAELAVLGHVSRARITQIMDLLYLAPDIQESILFLTESGHGNSAIHERDLRQLLRITAWEEQRTHWRKLSD
jgi:hypothetical protein